MEDDIQFENMDTWKGSGSKFGLSFKQIVLMHINRCVTNGSVEWHGGFWQESSISDLGVKRVYVPNTREVYCNSIRTLRALMLGYYDKQIQDEDKRIMENIKFNDDNKNTISKEEFFTKKIELHLLLFEQLVLLGKRLNFFEEIEVIEMI